MDKLDKEKFIFETVVGAVPQWYVSDDGNNSRCFMINDHQYTFYCHINLTPYLSSLFTFCNARIQHWYDELPSIPTSSYKKLITEEIALKWLAIQSADIDWYKLASYADELLYRTYENTAVTINMLISDGEGIGDITDKSIQKLIDPLATSQQVYIKVNHNLEFICYDQISWDDISESNTYKFHPEFLQPFHCKLERNEYSFHVTLKGDIIILRKGGIVASCRKGMWFIYDVQTFKNSIGDVTEDYRVGCNLFELMFDLSYKRHGALLVYDPGHVVLPNVVNRESILHNNDENMDVFRSLFKNSVYNLAMGAADLEAQKKRLLIELASMDGAVIFDNNKILAIGAMIRTHDDAGGNAGARSTAFESSFLYGGKPCKISSDGDISFKFYSGGSKSVARLNFL